MCAMLLCVCVGDQSRATVCATYKDTKYCVLMAQYDPDTDSSIRYASYLALRQSCKFVMIQTAPRTANI